MLSIQQRFTKLGAPQEDIEVEVSLDGHNNLYSVMVSDHATNTVQSVMSIPMKVDENIRRNSKNRLVQNSYSQVTGVLVPRVAVDATATMNRRADVMRNLSPINNERSSPFDASHHNRRRRQAQSMPPARSRSSDKIDTGSCSIGLGSHKSKRDISCAPVLSGRSWSDVESMGENSVSVRSAKDRFGSKRFVLPSPVISNNCFQKSNKPDFVSKSSARGFLKSLTSSNRKVHMTPKMTRSIETN